MKFLTIVGITVRERLPDTARYDWEWKSDPDLDEECGAEEGEGIRGRLSRTESDGTDVPALGVGAICLPCAKQLVRRP